MWVNNLYNSESESICNISCIQSHITFLILIPSYRHGVREAGVVDAGTKRLLGQAGLKQTQGLDHLLVEVLCRLVGHLKVQVVGIKPGSAEWQRCKPTLYPKQTVGHSCIRADVLMDSFFGIGTFPLDPSAWWWSWHWAGQRGWSLGPGMGALPPHRLCADSSRLGCPTWWMHWLHLSWSWQFKHHSSVPSVFFEMQHGAQTPKRYNLDSKKSWRGLLMQKCARNAVTALLSRVFFRRFI